MAAKVPRSGKITAQKIPGIFEARLFFFSLTGENPISFTQHLWGFSLGLTHLT